MLLTKSNSILNYQQKTQSSVKLGPFNIKSYATLISGGLFNSY